MSNLYPPSTTIPIYAVFTGTALVLTGLRFYVRLSFAPSLHNRQPLSYDDFFIVLGMVVVCICTGIQFYNALHGTGGAAVSDGEAKKRKEVAYRIDFTMIVIEKVAFGAIKLSLLFFYRRLFSIFESFQRINRVLICLIVLWTVSFIFADLLLCGKNLMLNFDLDQTRARRACGDKGALLISFAATSVLTDAMVLALPLFYIRKVRMRRSKRGAASFVFLLGAISTLAGILRLVFLCVAYPMGRVTFGYTAPPHDKQPLLLRVFNPTFWVMIEMLLGIWAANLPPLAPLMRKCIAQYRGSWLHSTFTSAYGTNSKDSSDLEYNDMSTIIIEKRIKASIGA